MNWDDVTIIRNPNAKTNTKQENKQVKTNFFSKKEKKYRKFNK